MTDQDQTAHYLDAISDGLVGLFADYCQRTASPDLANLLVAYREHRLDLVLTAHASIISGVDFVCCALPVGSPPADIVELFTIHTVPATPTGRAH